MDSLLLLIVTREDTKEPEILTEADLEKDVCKITVYSKCILVMITGGLVSQGNRHYLDTGYSWHLGG